MIETKDKNNKSQGRGRDKGKGLCPEDRALWDAYAQDIVPLEKPAVTVPEESGLSLLPPPPAFPYAKAKAKVPYVPVSKPAPVPQQPPQLDGSTETKLRRGKIAIDATLDLHGMTQAEAHARLSAFVTNASRRQSRCLLVITGKSREHDNDRGILNRRLSEWASLPPLSGMILKVSKAARHHGGSGAFYLYLKRQR